MKDRISMGNFNPEVEGAVTKSLLVRLAPAIIALHEALPDDVSPGETLMMGAWLVHQGVTHENWERLSDDEQAIVHRLYDIAQRFIDETADLRKSVH